LEGLDHRAATLTAAALHGQIHARQQTGFGRGFTGTEMQAGVQAGQTE
jgi:hypothetical protein